MSLSLYVGSVLTEGGLFCFVVHTIPSALLITVNPQCPLMGALEQRMRQWEAATCVICLVRMYPW